MAAIKTMQKALDYISLIAIVGATFIGFTFPEADRVLGDVQRLFYIHFGSFGAGFLALAFSVVAGIRYLQTRQAVWDHLGAASIKTGLVMLAINIVTGAFVARAVWGVFWVWDPRLTSVAIMTLTYTAYSFLRAGFDHGEQQRRFAAVYSILAFSSVLLVLVITRLRSDTLTPAVVGSLSASNAFFDVQFSARVGYTILANIVAYSLLSASLIWHEVRLASRGERLRARLVSAMR